MAIYFIGNVTFVYLPLCLNRVELMVDDLLLVFALYCCFLRWGII
jgi:hypothetical protein